MLPVRGEGGWGFNACATALAPRQQSQQKNQCFSAAPAVRTPALDVHEARVLKQLPMLVDAMVLLVALYHAPTREKSPLNDGTRSMPVHKCKAQDAGDVCHISVKVQG